MKTTTKQYTYSYGAFLAGAASLVASVKLFLAAWKAR